VNHIETELKLKLLEPECWQQIAEAELLPATGSVGAVKRDFLESQYYDTPSRRLQKAQMAYRIRMEEGRWMATVKAGGSSDGGLHRREEYTAVLTEQEPSIAVFLGTPAGERLQKVIGDEPLEAIFTTRFSRYKRDITTPNGSCIELAVDLGEIISGGQSEPIGEVELELKAGHPSAVLALGSELAKAFPLRVEPRSKYFRGLQLAGLQDEIEIDSKTTAYQFHGNEPAFSVIPQFLTAILIEVLNAEEMFLQNSQEPEALHRLRIDLRRLRAALSFAKPLLSADEYERYQAALLPLGAASGYLRQLDVAAQSWQKVLDSGFITVSGRLWLTEVLADERQAAVEAFASPLRRGSATVVYLGLWAWLANEMEASPIAKESGGISLHAFITVRVYDWLEELLKAGESLDLTDPVSLHAFRIRGKKLRYMLEAFSDQTGNAAKLLGRLKKLQDGLGFMRDIQATALLLNEWLQTRSSRALHRDAGLLMGWQAHEMLNKQTEFCEDWQRFYKTASKWLKKNSAKNK